MSLLTFGIITLAVGLTLMSAQASADDPKPQAASMAGNGRHCVVNNRVYHHGQIFTIGNSRCIKYLCYDGQYDFVEEGCDKWNRCRPVDKVFKHECRDYVCRATVVLGSYKKYDIKPVSVQECKDHRGMCHPYDQFFAYVLDGRLKRRCTCRPTGLSITYYCYD